MAAVQPYDFGRFAVLVAEDNAHMRFLLYSVLKELGVGRVETAKDGGEAIEYLKLVASNPQRAGVMALDLVLSNWQMKPVDGLELLRWVRRSEESPDRFLPFVLITAHADVVALRRARDAGVTEFMAKPYSIASLCNRLLAVVERPRQFVSSRKYFGPDRRRRVQSHDGLKRRKVTERDVEIVYESE